MLSKRSFLILTLGSNKVTKSPVPPMKAPDMALKAIAVSIVRSVLGFMPCCFKVYSSVISGIPPLRPPMMYFPFRSSKVKFSIGFLDIMKDPSLLVSPANVIG